MKWDNLEVVDVKTEQVIDENPQTWIEAAHEDFDAGNYDSALEKLQQARVFANNDPTILTIIYSIEIFVYFAQGDKSAAREATHSLREYGNLAKLPDGTSVFESLVTKNPILAHICMDVNPNEYFWKKTWRESVDNIIKEKDFEIIEDLLAEKEIYSFTEKTLADHADDDFAHAVVINSKLNLLQALHRGGFNLSACKFSGSDKRNLTMETVINDSSSDILEFLLDNKINGVNDKDNYGQTALMFLADSDSKTFTVKNFKLLISAGADVNAIGDAGQTALIIAAESERYSADKIRILIDSGANVSFKDSDDFDAIYYTDDAVCLRLLAQHGASVNQHYAYAWGQTLLHMVAEDNHWQRSSYWETLLYLGVDVNAKDNNDNTPLEYALDHSWTFTAELDLPRALVKKGATVTYEAKQIMRRRGIKESNLYNKSTNFFFSSWFK